MADVWDAVNDLDPSVQNRLIDVLEARGADPRQQAMRTRFLADIEFPDRGTVVEVGCGTGVLTRRIAATIPTCTVIGIDPAASLVARAAALGAGLPNLSFAAGDARALPLASGSVDVVVFDSTLSHIAETALALDEASRILSAGGILAAFDGDYATATVAFSDHDPLQVCVDAMMRRSVTDRWLVRRLTTLVADQFSDPVLRSYGYAEAADGAYMLSIVDRGAELLAGDGVISADLASALRAEARRRVAQKSFYGFIAYGSIVARKPDRRNRAN